MVGGAEGGRWERVCWQRQPDAKWIQTHSEAITDGIREEAGEPVCGEFVIIS